MRDLIEADPFKRKKPWSWINSDDDFFSLRLPKELEKKDFRQPAIRMLDDGKNLVVSAELPGIDKKGLNVTFSGQSVAIRAKRTAVEKKKQNSSIVYSEFSQSQFFRQLPLPEPINVKKTKVVFKNGVLNITCPKVKSSSDLATKPKTRHTC